MHHDIANEGEDTQESEENSDEGEEDLPHFFFPLRSHSQDPFCDRFCLFCFVLTIVHKTFHSRIIVFSSGSSLRLEKQTTHQGDK